MNWNKQGTIKIKQKQIQIFCENLTLRESQDMISPTKIRLGLLIIAISESTNLAPAKEFELVSH